MAFSGAFVPPFHPAFNRGGAARNGLLNNLIAYWPLNEAAGANDALDLHTNALTLTQSGSPGSGTGKVYSTARLYGNNVYHYRTSETLLNIGDNDWTLAAWFNTKTLTNNTGIWGKYASSGSQGLYHLIWYSSDLYAGFRKANNTATVEVRLGNVLTSSDTWRFVVAWHDSVNDIVGISIDNGTLVTNALAGGVREATDQFRVGSYYAGTGSESWRDRVGPVAMWKSAAGLGGVLTAVQRTALYNAGAGLAYSAFTT